MKNGFLILLTAFALHSIAYADQLPAEPVDPSTDWRETMFDPSIVKALADKNITVAWAWRFDDGTTSATKLGKRVGVCFKFENKNDERMRLDLNVWTGRYNPAASQQQSGAVLVETWVEPHAKIAQPISFAFALNNDFASPIFDLSLAFVTSATVDGYIKEGLKLKASDSKSDVMRADALMQQAEMADPQNPYARLERAGTMLRLQDFKTVPAAYRGIDEEAITAINLFIGKGSTEVNAQAGFPAFYPSVAVGDYIHANCLRMLGDTDGAKKFIGIALRIEPANQLFLDFQRDLQ